jgi:hypothetical protein
MGLIMEPKKRQDPNPALTDLEDGLNNNTSESPPTERDSRQTEFTSVYLSLLHILFAHMT